MFTSLIRTFQNLKERRVEESFTVVLVLASMAGGFIGPTYMLFLLSHGLTKLEANEVNVLFMAALFLLQTPTGAFADIFGRKTSVVLGQLFWSIGAFVYFRATGFWGFVAGEMGAALGRSFLTGAFNAWLLDHLATQGKKEEYQKILSRGTMLSRAALVPVAFLAGYVGENVSLALPWALAGGVSVLATIAAIVLMRPDSDHLDEKGDKPKKGLGALLSITGDSMKHVFKTRTIVALIVATTLLVFSVQSFNMFWTPIFKEGLGQKYLGALFALFNLAIAFGYWLASRDGLKKRHPLTSLIAICFFEGVPMLIASVLQIPILLLVAFAIHEVPRGAFEPVFSAYFNEFVPAKLRATVNSVGATFNSVGAITGLLVSGWVADRYSMLTTWTISASIILFVAILLVVLARRKNGAR